MTSAIALTRESTSRTSLFFQLVAVAMQVRGEAGGVDARFFGEEERARHVEALGDDHRVTHAEDRPRARTIVAQVSSPAWSSKTSRGGTPWRTSALRIVSGSS